MLGAALLLEQDGATRGQLDRDRRRQHEKRSQNDHSDNERVSPRNAVRSWRRRSRQRSACTLAPDGASRRRRQSRLAAKRVSAASVAQCPWRDLTPWDLDDFYRRIRADVSELEEAFAQHKLGKHAAISAYVGPEIADAYHMLPTVSNYPIPDLREEAVHGLLETVRLETFHISHHATAEMVGNAPRLHAKRRCVPSPYTHISFRARMGDSPEESLRFDQILAARFWGIDFDFENIEVSNEVAHQVAHDTTRRLAEGLRRLHYVLGHFKPKGGRPPHIVPHPRERRFDHLMLDVLNELDRCARLARLDDDFLAKTDLRVNYPDLNRQKGVRVQVTQIYDEAMHAEKIGRIVARDEFVVLSPRTIAEFMAGGRAEARTEAEWSDFWRHIPDLDAPITAIARTLARMFSQAIDDPQLRPRGPMSIVPVTLRELIRAFVREDAFRATRAKHARHGEPKSLRTRPHVPHEPPPLDETGAERAQALLEGLREGACVVGRVTNTKDYGAFVDLGGVDGLLHVSEMRGQPVTTFVIGQDIEVVVLRVDRERRRVGLGLPKE
jgi:hypothetical protein